ncbi:serine/threonine-protein kinase [Streptomyces sp. NBC_00199]|uniref:serine/threonine-protein kinase n=1 Tax=Streptomyces sp. NBC_00199 TaxID=2975678 RepID=UPI00224FD4C6|nr:serine/threonine-protein kinase [Streptomyces sp. NBC_00199]MCX5268436.1 serine/threonine protein kinase [Streptomyces sp. NBC_00199]
MSHHGGVGPVPDDTTSFVLQPPNPHANPHPQPHPLPHANPLPHPHAAPGAEPSQTVPSQGLSQEPSRTPVDGAAQEPGVGRLVAGRYRLLAKLGHGGMGTVWRAKDETVDREVAVKEPRVPDHLPERERDKAFERMRREARAAARLDHPAVVGVHDVAVVDGRPWIVMELVHGRSLGDALQEGTLGTREAARIGLEVLGALEAAHAAGILHRDVKPDNVLLGRYDRVVLTDFGIAQIEGETNLTDTGGFVGSPEYIAPERVLGRRPGPAADLWSLGVVLYAATEGVSPFRRSNTPATLQSVLNAAPAPPAAAHGPLAEVVDGLLQKEPAHRPTAARVRELLEAAANPSAPQPPQPPQAVSPPEASRVWRRPGRAVWIGLGAAVVAAAAAAYLVFADPFAGPLPDGWTTKPEKSVTATLAVPDSYVRSEPEKTAAADEHWVGYTDPSGAISVVLRVDRRAEDTGHRIKDSAAAQMYADNGDFKESGSYPLDMPKGPGTRTDDNATFHGRKAAGNTVVYTTDDSRQPAPRELRILYYKSTAGDMYKLMIGYPGKGDFTARGREVARTAIAHLEIDRP